MSAVELALEKVRKLSENEACELLTWLRAFENGDKNSSAVASISDARGFARRYRAQPRPTDDWMKELREGER